MAPAEDFPEMLRRTLSALQSLVAGDPGPYLALWSHDDDMSVMGGFGGWLRGWDQVRQNTAAAASRFAAGQLQVEPLTTGASAELAYAVWIERGDVRLAGAAGPTPLVVRVTQISAARTAPGSSSIGTAIRSRHRASRRLRRLPLD